MCKFFVNLVCCFIPSRHLRHIFREKYGPKKYYNIVGNNNVIYFGEKQTIASLDYWNTKKDQVIFNGIASSEEERTNYQIGEKNDSVHS